jgi:hypothetical protein
MPQAKRSTTARSRAASARSRSTSTSARSRAASASTRARAAFKEPAALKRLNNALDQAQKAVADLGAHSGREAGKGARDLHRDVRGFVSNARRDSGKLGTALRRDFEQAQKQIAKATKAARGSKTTARRSSTSKAAPARKGASRTTAKRRTTKRS